MSPKHFLIDACWRKRYRENVIMYAYHEQCVTWGNLLCSLRAEHSQLGTHFGSYQYVFCKAPSCTFTSICHTRSSHAFYQCLYQVRQANRNRKELSDPGGVPMRYPGAVREYVASPFSLYDRRAGGPALDPKSLTVFTASQLKIQCSETLYQIRNMIFLTNSKCMCHDLPLDKGWGLTKPQSVTVFTASQLNIQCPEIAYQIRNIRFLTNSKYMCHDLPLDKGYERVAKTTRPNLCRLHKSDVIDIGCLM